MRLTFCVNGVNVQADTGKCSGVGTDRVVLGVSDHTGPVIVGFPGIREHTWWFRVDRVPLAAATQTIQHSNAYSIPGRSWASIGMASYLYVVLYLRPKSIPTSVSSFVSQPSPYVFFGRSYVHSLPSLKHRPFMMLWSRTNSVFVAVFDRLLYHVRSLLSLFLPLLTTMYLHQKRRTILCSCPTS